MALIGRLTTFQLRAHYTLYRATKRVYDGERTKMTMEGGKARVTTFLSYDDFWPAIGDVAAKDRPAILNHICEGLARERLTGGAFGFGQHSFLLETYPDAPTAGLVFAPSVHGIELFLWAHGHGGLSWNRFFRADLTFPIFAGSTPLDSARHIDRKSKKKAPEA